MKHSSESKTLKKLFNTLVQQNKFIFPLEGYVEKLGVSDKQGSKLRGCYSFKYQVVEDDRSRALLESLSVGILCPKHLGLGKNRQEKISKIRK